MILSTSQQNLLALPAGTEVRVRHLFFSHVGMLSDRFIGGERGVLAFSAKAGGLIEEPLSVFAAGKDVEFIGYPGGLPPETVMQRARGRRGLKYDALGFNCEHFVRYAHGLPVESPQLKFWVRASGTVVALAILAKTLRK